MKGSGDEKAVWIAQLALSIEDQECILRTKGIGRGNNEENVF